MTLANDFGEDGKDFSQFDMNKFNFLPSLEMKIHTSKDLFVQMLNGQVPEEEKEDTGAEEAP